MLGNEQPSYADKETLPYSPIINSSEISHKITNQIQRDTTFIFDLEFWLEWYSISLFSVVRDTLAAREERNADKETDVTSTLPYSSNTNSGN